MRVAAIDLGTNTFLLLIADVSSGRIDSVLHDEVQLVRLGQAVHESRRFHPDALERARKCFASFSLAIRKFNVHKVLACATSAARDVSNGDELIKLGREFGIPIEIISGEKEAELTFWGTVSADLKEPVVIIDVGGGSTEFILGDKTGLVARQSIDVGSVRLTEMFVTEDPIPEFQLDAMTTYIQEKVESARASFPVDDQTKLLAVAGTPTTIASMDQGLAFESDRVHGHMLTLKSLRDWIEAMARMTVDERRALAGMEPKRADVIVAGALILMLSMRALGATQLEVSVRGLRYGIARKLAGELK